ncbi:MAG TPA: cation-translocating P-type ATPase, partial [Candidatus Kapabacteria bacterium]|nr:cation-translocating P-type ATPase [Candidatus Kapabacteria bacterium]
EHKEDVIRLGATAAALVLSWSGIWKWIAPFDFIALAATLIGGYPMFKEAFDAIRERKMSMELSMSIAVLATVCIGQFFTGLVITFFVLFAELLEDMTVEGGRDVLDTIIRLLPHSANVRRGDKEVEIDITELSLHDTVIIKPGSKIPVDGVVMKGNSFVEQAAITGESLPVEKIIGSTVFAGTINQSGVLEVKPERIGKDTTFGRIVEIIEQAESSKAPIERVADKMAARLVYFAFAGAIITFFITHNIVFAISALIVAGACGVAAGTPLAVLAGIGRTAKEGIIVKGGAYMEQLGSVDTVVLDKTGTLTLGAPKVVRLQSFNGVGANDILRFAATAEQHSEHPLGQAIMNEAKRKNISVPSYSDVKYLPGKGMICEAENGEICVGNASLLKDVLLEADMRTLDSVNGGKGETTVFVAAGGELIGAIGIADTPRPEAKEAVKELRKLGCMVILLTGDSSDTAKAIGDELQVDDVIAEVLPEQKLEKIRALKANGKKVAMVGDGVNDAPALIEAHVGIAMGAGTDVALESADMALTTNNLLKIVEAFRISRQCMRVIKFNFWGTVIVDTVGMSLAPLGFLTPLLGALIHVGSETAFILNSARLFRK